ncbi:MAG: 3-deoxy-7-phosphoheptulonate synthase [Sinimarinibacterium sp.]|jgi:3-deoxy-7-phosphoheptulonate synthase
MRFVTENTRIKSISEVSTPAEIQAELPLTDAASRTTFNARREVQDLLHGRDDRLLVIVGPCSIHDTEAALDYARRLLPLREQLSKHLQIVMRVYFEKPRTTVGWKGLINDPDLNDQFNINKGLRVGRKLLLQLNEMGVPAGVEYLDILTPQYLTDLVTWGAIGARTTESQLHRELASALSCPVGFKNGTEGSVKVAVDAVMSASHPHRFLSLTHQGHVAIFETTGNEDCHIILRGGSAGTNYDAKSVDAACAALTKVGLRPQVMIDFSHANSSKQHKRQVVVGNDVAHQIAGGDERVIGVMIESHILEGRQDVKPGEPLAYGQSITDACIHWEDTAELLRHLANAVERRRLRNARSA